MGEKQVTMYYLFKPPYGNVVTQSYHSPQDQGERSKWTLEKGHTYHLELFCHMSTSQKLKITRTVPLSYTEVSASIGD